MRWAPYGLVAFLYLATSPYHRGLNNPNEMVRVYMSVAAVEDGSFAIDGVIRRWGMVDDKAIRDGKLYSSKAPLQSLVGVPAYVLARPILDGLGLPRDPRHVTFALRALATLPFAVLFSWALLAWARRRALELGAERAHGTALGLALALGTMHYAYALNFTGHALAAATAGGCFLAVAALARTPSNTPRWRTLALTAGALAGLTPFAEYPAALVALPALFAALLTAGRSRDRLRLFGWLAVGGVLPFGLGLWSHAELWGSPFATGYGFLENPGYVEVHGKGFFGVTAPKPLALFGTLFSPGTGLFWFSPVLALGLIPLGLRVMGRGPRERLPALSSAESEDASAAPIGLGDPGRIVAMAALLGFILELLFISGHRGWRGGWTLGPRYIIPVVTVLGFGCIEGLALRWLRGPMMALAALSILLTGPAAALYPHLSDVYTHPLKTFLLPSYLRGEMSYGLAHAVGLVDHAANAVHGLPLLAAALAAAWAGTGGAIGARLRTLGLTFAIAGAVLYAIPEAHPKKARRENRRLWRFWEPEEGGPHARVAHARASSRVRLGSARMQWAAVRVRRWTPQGQATPCEPEGRPCHYGEAPWQRFGPEQLDMDGQRKAVLFMHPVAGDVVEATVPVPKGTGEAILRYGLADASVEADNPELVELRVEQDGRLLGVAQAGADYGLQALELTLTSTAPVTVSARVARDGARVLGWDLEFYEAP